MEVAHIEISLTGETATHGEEENYTYDDNLAMHGNSSTVFRRSSGPVNALFKIGFDGLLGLGTFPPIHEDITIAAFIKSNLRTQFPRGTNYTNLSEESWEFFRGVIWCDDPSCLLFVDSETDNRLFGAGTDFGSQFEFGDPTCLTRRSHFGNLQFLHGMATRFNETPTETKANILRWLEVMYKLAIGNQGIAETDRLDQRLPSAMSGSPLPPNGGQTLRDLLLGTTPSYRTADISKRALGVCLHMLQDSYAVGHTLRRLLNIEDLDGKDGKGKSTPELRTGREHY